MAFVSSGKVTSGNQFHDYAAGTFEDGASYEWQVRTYDAQGVAGPWSTLRAFSAITPSNVQALIGGTWVESGRYIYSSGAWVRHNPAAQ